MTPAPFPPLSLPRRQALALGTGLLLPGLAASWPLSARAAPAQPASAAHQQLQRPLMGTTVRLIAEAGPAMPATALPEAMAQAMAHMAELAALMTHYDAASGTGAIALAAGLQPVAVAPPLMAVLQQAQSLSARSGGAFDITIGAAGLWRFDDPARLPHPDPAQVARGLPLVGWRQLQLDTRAGTAWLPRRGMRLDLGGIAKLPILAAGLQALRAAGVQRALVDGGGDVLAISPPDRPAWRVGVRDPARPGALLGVLALRNGVVASSGDYERCTTDTQGRRWHHVLDPRTGRPAEAAHGVTLLAHAAADAPPGRGPATGGASSPALDAAVARVNGLGAALMVLDEARGRALLDAAPDGAPPVQALVTRRDGTRWGGLTGWVAVAGPTHQGPAFQGPAS